MGGDSFQKTPLNSTTPFIQADQDKDCPVLGAAEGVVRLGKFCALGKVRSGLAQGFPPSFPTLGNRH